MYVLSVTNVLHGSSALDQKWDEIKKFIPLICGLANPHVEKLYKKDHQYHTVYGTEKNGWGVYLDDHKVGHPVDFVVLKRDGESFFFFSIRTPSDIRPKAAEILLIHRELQNFLNGMLSFCPGIKLRLMEFIDAIPVAYN